MSCDIKSEPFRRRNISPTLSQRRRPTQTTKERKERKGRKENKQTKNEHMFNGLVVDRYVGDKK